MKKFLAFSTMALWLALNPAANADEAVRSAQTILKSAGYYSGEATGELDAETKASLRRYQIHNDLQPTGELTPETVAALNKEGEEAPQPAAPVPSAAPAAPAPAVPLETAPTPPPVLPKQPVPTPSAAVPPPSADYSGYYARTPYANAPVEAQRDTLRRAQAILSERRLYAGPVNGVPNPETEEALLRFQSSRDLPRTGVLDIDTLAELHLLPVKKPRLRELPPPGAVRGVPLD